jgi:hypothetical protein
MSIRLLITIAAGTAGLCFAAPLAAADSGVTKQLNDNIRKQARAESTAWQGLFDAYLDMTDPPMAIGAGFNQTTIHPGMDDWAAVSDWAITNKEVAAALATAADKVIIGLPYGSDAVDARYRDAGLAAVVRLEPDGEVEVDFPYMQAFDAFATWTAANLYTQIEAGEYDAAFDAAVSNARVLRHLCDRQMLTEKSTAMRLLAESLSVMRDAMYTSVDRIPADVYARIATKELPFLKVSDTERLKRLELPEGDRLVFEAVLDEVFLDNGAPDPERLAEVFGVIQSEGTPLTRFGASKRWERIAEIHGSLDASKEKLTDVYDDWWRRWKIKPYDPIQALPSEYSRLNEVRYAIVAESIADMTALFAARNQLAVEINGTILGCGLCGYRVEYGKWPEDREKAYVRFIPKRFDFDPYDKGYGRLLFDYVGSRKEAVETDYGRIFVSNCIVYARGDDHEDSGFKEASLDGMTGDMVVWPPLRALAREQGLID